MKILLNFVCNKINTIILISIISSILQAQVESHFLLYRNGVKFDSSSPYLVVTHSIFAENASKTSVKTMPGNERNREIYNKSHGVYLTTFTQDVPVGKQHIKSLASLTEARAISETEGYFSNTKFSHMDGKVQTRTNCKVSEKWGMFTTARFNSGELFSCVTANDKFCSLLEGMKKKLKVNSFKEASKEIENCAKTLGSISGDLDDLYKYTKSDEYKSISKIESENLYGLRKNTKVDLGLRMKFSSIAPEDKETFSIGSNESTISSVLALSDKIKEASIACAAYEDANRVISEHLGSHSSGKGGNSEDERRVTQ